MTIALPELPYPYDALWPFISSESLEFHHDKHHQAYVDNANKLLVGTDLEHACLEDQIRASNVRFPALFNNISQHYNHLHFWNWMRIRSGGAKLPATLEKAIRLDLGGYEKFRADFISMGVSQFGSGWAWLSLRNGKLEITKTPNGENPLLTGAAPLLGVDVWEHSYYIDYRNGRQKYLEAFVDYLINWDYVAQLYEKAR
jgi:Fe-Mn family superoxide dismutase